MGPTGFPENGGKGLPLQAVEYSIRARFLSAYEAEAWDQALMGKNDEFRCNSIRSPCCG